MAKSGSIIGKITEELGELGKKVVAETAKAPGDIAGQLFEKSSTTRGAPQTDQPSTGEPSRQKEKTPLDQLEETKGQKEKQMVARAALAYLAGQKKPPEPSVHERKQTEEREKKETVKKQAAAAAWQQLPQTGAAPRRGDLRNITKKQAGTETGKNIVNQ